MCSIQNSSFLEVSIAYIFADHIKDVNGTMWLVAPRGQQRDNYRGAQCRCMQATEDEALSEERKAATWHAKWKPSQKLLHILPWGVFIKVQRLV